MYEAFVVGNGISRLEFDLHKLKKIGPIYGCNNLYLDFTPDVLVAYDEFIIWQIEKSGYSETNVVYSMYPGKKTGSLHLDDALYSNSGACALHLAAKHGFQTVYFLGFDLINKYKEASNVYHKSHIKETSFWDPLTTVFSKFKGTKFVRVGDFDNDISDWLSLDNFSKLKSYDFKSKFNLLE